MEQYTSEDARREWRRILNEVERGEPVGITRYGKPLATVVPAGWYDTVVAYIGATTFTPEAAAFYAREREAGNPVLVEDALASRRASRSETTETAKENDRNA